MKEKDFELKQLIKEAVLEALVEFTNQNVAVTAGDNTNNGNSDENSGGGLNNGRPKPNVGVGTFGLR